MEGKVLRYYMDASPSQAGSSFPFGAGSSFPFGKTDLFLPFRIGKTAHQTLQEFIDIDVTVSDLVRILNANQAYRDLFFRFVAKKTAKKSDDDPTKEVSHTSRLIHLLGMLGSRNLIVALRLQKLSEGKFPISPEGSVEINAGDTIRLALEAEDIFIRNKIEYSETAFAAGVYYDLCLRHFGKNDPSKKFAPYLKRIWTRALRTGLVAFALAERIPGSSPKTALAAGMLAHAGKVHASLHFAQNNYMEFEEEIDKNPALPPLACLLLERQRFGCAHEDIGSHILHYFDLFLGLAEPIANYREPYNMKGSKSYPLCVLLNLADAMVRSWKLPVDEQDPVFGEWTYPGLKDLKVKRALLIEAMEWAMRLK